MGIIRNTEVCMPDDIQLPAPEETPVLFKKARKKAPTKAEALKSFAVVVHDEEVLRGQNYIAEFLQRPVFDLPGIQDRWGGSELLGTLQALYTRWQVHRDAGFPKGDLDPLEILRLAWEGGVADDQFLNTFTQESETHRYLAWLFLDEDIVERIPAGWTTWEPGTPLEAQEVMKAKAARTKKSEEAGEAALKAPKVKKEPKPKEPKEPKDLRSVFRKRLETLTPESLRRPWMATKALRLITDPADLQAWADKTLADTSRYRPCAVTGEMMPVVAVDTENAAANGGASGLDTRVVNGLFQLDSAGICLSADGIEGLYVPLTHEDGNNCPREDVARILQHLFDRCLTVYFNAKYDREVLTFALGMKLRPYPYFEDVQILQFLLDPKSPEEEEVSSFESAGLKALALRYTGCEMLELGALAKVRARYVNPTTGKVSERQILAPFNWIPTHLALPYAGGDGIFTWLLWEMLHEEARKMKFAHKVDHRLADALAWVERQRPLIDTEKHAVICRWHAEKLQVLGDELSKLSKIEGFNPGSTPQLSRVLFETYGFPVIKRSAKTGAPSTDADVIEELMKSRPGHPFLTALVHYREYSALHPAHLRYDPRDHTARLYFKQCTVAGGRLAAMGGKFENDGGFGLNPQAIVTVGGNKWVTLRRLRLEDTDSLGATFDPTTAPMLALEDIHPSCIKDAEQKIKIPNPAYIPPPPLSAPKDGLDNWQGSEGEAERLREIEAHQAGIMAMEGIPEFLETTKVVPKLHVPRVTNMHIARYCGEWWSLAKDEESIALSSGEVIHLDPPAEVDANEVVNLRSLFLAPEGYSFFVVDYSNVEMRVAANVSGEAKFIEEFMTGSGDFHTLTAKNVYPEFNHMQQLIKELKAQDPRGLDAVIQDRIGVAKAKMKKLRSMAKVINFALLYGGTEHAIFEGMKKEDPTITRERAAEMVTTYWDSVPSFKEWAQTQMARARDTFTCVTASGRRIDFKSAMRAQKITDPLPEHWTNYRAFWDIKRRAEKALAAGKREEAAVLEARAQEMRRDKSTGVANLGDYKKFVSKIQRVATNAPLQGLAGDFMRAALGYVHQWVQKMGIGDVMLLHATVHDEIDFSVKNEYVPYVIPRVIRLMKLRQMHTLMKWPVPLECDCEYGPSWDVKEHLTGDDTHSPAGYTRIPGLGSYIPAIFDPETVEGLRAAIMSSDPGDRKGACDYLREVTHPRCHVNIPKLEGMPPKQASEALTAILQLHEYWTVDFAEGGDDDETLEEYQLRMGLIPGEHVSRPVLTFGPDASDSAPALSEPQVEEVPPVAPEPVVTEPTAEGATRVPKLIRGYPILRDLNPEEDSRLKAILGVGSKGIKVRSPQGRLNFLSHVRLEKIPEEFLVMEAVLEDPQP